MYKFKRYFKYALTSPSLKFLLIFLSSAVLFCFVTVSVLQDGAITYWNLPLQHWMQTLRQPILDGFMVCITLVDINVMLLMWLAIGIYLFIQKQFWSASSWMILGGMVFLFSFILKILIVYPRPMNIVHQHLSSAFPSGHVFIHTALLGSLSFLINAHKSAKTKYLHAVFLCLWILLLMFSRVYLGAHWFSDVIGGSLLGISSIALFLFFYTLPVINTTSVQRSFYTKHLGLIALLSIIIAWGINLGLQYTKSINRYTLITA